MQISPAHIAPKVIGYFFRNAGDELKANIQVKKMAIVLSSIVFSVAAWMATILGAASVLGNRSDSLLVSWIFFPVSSLIILLVITAWLLTLSILMPQKKPRTE